ncbi:alpha-amylase-related protein [Bemisia tabaci]|uniref:alpha-amylase-related protein n=1 Tax=Bemisia tabaci TaxID=7038 RepID=UPI003B27E881
MELLSKYIIILLCLHSTMGQFDTGMSGDRRVIVHLFEWPFNAIKEECKMVLGPQKFGGVLVQSVNEHILIKKAGNIRRPWYERYQPLSWDIISRLGTEQQFKEMVEECNKNDVRVYVDTVLNHATGSIYGGVVEGVGGTRADVNFKSYPGLGFNRENFHTTCQINWKDKITVRNCELSGLQDVDQSQEYVRGKIVEYLNKLISYGVAGFRVDAAMHMWPKDLQAIYSKLRDVSLNDGKTTFRPTWMLEVHDEDGSYQDDYKDIGSEYEFEFLARVKRVFKKMDSSLASIYQYVKQPRYLSKKRVALTSNQDEQRREWIDRFSSEPDRSGVQQVVDAFILTFTTDIPSIFSGYSYTDQNAGPPMNEETEEIKNPLNCSDGWMCEHRFKPLQWIIKFFTNFVQDAPVETWFSDWTNGSPLQAAFIRGKKGFAVFNADVKSLKQTFKVPLPAGVYCDLATGYFCQHHQMCMGGLKRRVEVKEDGSIEVSLPGMIRSSNNCTAPATEPPYLAISLQSKYPDPETPNPIVETIGWIVLAVAVVVGVGVVTWFLCRQSKSNREIQLVV